MTKIEWAQESWNPATGCTPVSEGCRSCYARRMAYRLKGRYGYPSDDPFRVTFHPDRLDIPLKWKKPRRIFVCSMGDLFHNNILDRQIGSILARTHYAPQHTYIVLTKRAERMKLFMGKSIELFEKSCYLDQLNYPIPPPNLWLGVTVESPDHYDRIETLLKIPAAVRFVSFEPLLARMKWVSTYIRKIDWGIIGCESGPKRRKTDMDWIKELKDIFLLYDKPVFIKQAEIDGKIVKMPEIDGQIWDSFPIRERSVQCESTIYPTTLGVDNIKREAG